MKTITFVSEVDNELFNPASSRNLTLVSDDLKLIMHCGSAIITEVSTYFLCSFVACGLFDRKKALKVLEKMKFLRGWESNWIYVNTKRD